MKISLIFLIYLGFIVSARKRKQKYSISEESHESLPFVDDVLDLRGTVRRHFALEAALIEPHRSMICSPMSVMLPLGKLVLGAEKQTKEELLTAVGLGSSKQLSPAFTHLIANMKYLKGVTLDVVSRIYVASHKSINSKFEKNTNIIFGASYKKIDVENPRKAAQSINTWVAENTRHKIRHFISERDITQDTSLILVNAIYFAGNWLKKFERTLSKDFYAPSGARLVSMMQREGIYNYWKCNQLEAEIIEIPYEGSHVAMIIVLPTGIRGLPDLLRTMKGSPELLNQALEKMKSTNIRLTMPKFKIETQLNLNSLYKKIGVKTIFNRINSHLTDIIDDENIYVTKAIHKAVIEVNEKGTEASASTSVFGGMLSPAPSTPIDFIAHHPFYFVIRMYQEQLFTGTFNG